MCSVACKNFLACELNRNKYVLKPKNQNAVASDALAVTDYREHRQSLLLAREINLTCSVLANNNNNINIHPTWEVGIEPMPVQ